MKKDIDAQFLCKDCARYDLCKYYHNRKEDSYICKYFHINEPELDIYIKDNATGKIRLYGTDCHDSIIISDDGRTMAYSNLQNGDGSRYGNYRFCDKDGKVPADIDVVRKYGADVYFNIGGFYGKR